MEAFKGASFRSLDQIVIHPACKLRKIFTMKNPICDENDIEVSYDKTQKQYCLQKHQIQAQSIQSSLENLNATAQTDLQTQGKTPNKPSRNQKSSQQEIKKQNSNSIPETIKNSLMTSPDFNKQQLYKNNYQQQEEKKTQTVQGRRNAQNQHKHTASRSKSPYTSLVSPNNNTNNTNNNNTNNTNNNNSSKPNSKAQQKKPKLTLDQQSNSQQSTEMAQTPNLKQQHSAQILKKKQFSEVKQMKGQENEKTPLQIKNINPWGETNEFQQNKKQFDVKKLQQEEKKENFKKGNTIKNTKKNTKTSQINIKNKNTQKKNDFDETLFQERISKFNTISDPMSLMQQLEGDDEVLYYQNLGEEEIEEQLEIDITNKSHQQVHQNQIEDYFNEREVKMKVDDKAEEINPNKDLEDSLECEPPYRNFQSLEENKIQETEITQNSMLEGNPNQKPNFYEQQFNEIVENNMRPTSPPFLLYNQESKQAQEMQNICGKLQESTVDNEFLRKSELNNYSMISNSSKMLEVVYDPLLNCYYHPQTNTYYELNEMQNM